MQLTLPCLRLACALSVFIASALPCVAQGAWLNLSPRPHYSPLSASERTRRYLEETYITPVPFAVAAGGALLDQLDSYPPEWGQSGKYYGRRFGANYTRVAMGNSVREGLAASSGLEVRYLSCGCLGLGHRVFHSLKMTLLTYDYAGRPVLDLPQLTAVYSSNIAAANIWYPVPHSTFARGVQLGNIHMGVLGAFHIVQEFAPELRRLVPFRRKASAVLSRQ